MDESSKKCCTCHRQLALNAFGNMRTAPDGHNRSCLECQRAKSRSYYNRTKARRCALNRKRGQEASYRKRMRAQSLKRLYNLTLDQYCQLLQEQNGVCAICGSASSNRKSPINGIEHPLFVDHDHTTGRVRGLLCQTCNHGLGMFKDDPRLLANAIHYLESA